MATPFAALLAVVLLASGCGGDAAGDGSGDRGPAAGAEVGIDGSAAPPPARVEPERAGDAASGAGQAGSPGEPGAATDAEGPEGGAATDSAGQGSGAATDSGRQASGAATDSAGQGSGAATGGDGVDDSGGGESPGDVSEAADEPPAAEEQGAADNTAPAPRSPEYADAPPDETGPTEPEPTVPNPTGDAAAGEPDGPVPLAFGECGELYLCATLAVPVDHDDPGGAALELAVGMIPAGDPSRRVGYLLVNPGGPGGGMQGFLNGGAGLSSAVLDRFDVIGWDPRGVGGSVPAGCRDEARDLYLLDPIPDSPRERDALDAAARTLAEACAAGLGDVVGHIGTIAVVRDMDAIRRALGAGTISYLGFSYGTLLGVHYAGMYGEHLRAAVLDGVIDPSLTGAETAVGQMMGFARAIDGMFAWCRADPDCPVTGDPTETYDRLLERLDGTPSVDSAGRVTLDPARAILAVVVASYSSDFWPFFFGALAAAVEGDGTMLGLLGESYVDIADLGALVSIGCTDGGAPTRLDLDALTSALIEVAGDFGEAAAVGALPCEYWPVATGTLPVGAVAAPAAPPILVLGNRGDNATPHEWAVSVAGQLASGVLVSYDGDEHTSYGRSACVDRVVDAYLIDGVVPPGDVACPAEG